MLNGQIDGHRATAKTALTQRRAVMIEKKTRLLIDYCIDARDAYLYRISFAVKFVNSVITLIGINDKDRLLNVNRLIKTVECFQIGVVSRTS